LCRKKNSKIKERRKTINKCQLDDTGAKVEREKGTECGQLMTMRRATDAI